MFGMTDWSVAFFIVTLILGIAGTIFGYVRRSNNYEALEYSAVTVASAGLAILSVVGLVIAAVT